MPSPRRRRNPLPALIAIVVVPAVPLAAAVVWGRGSDPVQPPTPNAELDAGRTVPGTPILSLRRTPTLIADEINVSALRSEIEPFQERLNETSCLDVVIDGERVIQTRADMPVIPASNSKILTGAVALEVLGPDHRFVTRVKGALDPATGEVTGDLALVGGGDPLLSTDFYPDSFLATRYPQRPATRLEDLADAVVAAGVTSVSGGIVGDESRYDAEYFRPAWPESLHRAVVGPYSALMVNDARMNTSGAVAEVPGQGAAELFLDLLVERGVMVAGGASVGFADPAAPEIASVESAPFSEVLTHTMQTSDNNSAELLLKEIAVASGRPGTADDGLAVIVSTVESLGLPSAGLAPTDGSGLDIESQATCSVLAALLDRAGVDSLLGDSLPLLGVEGTLSNELPDHQLAGVVGAKTGSLGEDADRTDVKALSGVLPAEGTSGLVFSLVLNGGTVREEATYQPLWSDFLDALATYPAGPTASELGPAPVTTAS
jgi:D-alanyl-D-alanine carboxypeptidase/D-alanyl-D-alanine-endopeptidase (penicillin-binding protein 4)